MSERFGHSVDGIEYDFKFLYGCIGGVGTFLEDHPVSEDLTNHDEKCHQEALMAWMWLLVLNPFHLILKPQKPWCRGWIHIWLGPWGVSLVLRWPLQGCKMCYGMGLSPSIIWRLPLNEFGWICMRMTHGNLHGNLHACCGQKLVIYRDGSSSNSDLHCTARVPNLGMAIIRKPWTMAQIRLQWSATRQRNSSMKAISNSQVLLQAICHV